MSNPRQEEQHLHFATAPDYEGTTLESTGSPGGHGSSRMMRSVAPRTIDVPGIGEIPLVTSVPAEVANNVIPDSEATRILQQFFAGVNAVKREEKGYALSVLLKYFIINSSSDKTPFNVELDFGTSRRVLADVFHRGTNTTRQVLRHRVFADYASQICGDSENETWVRKHALEHGFDVNNLKYAFDFADGCSHYDVNSMMSLASARNRKLRGAGKTPAVMLKRKIPNASSGGSGGSGGSDTGGGQEGYAENF